jgi:hypothetical protein
VGEACPERRIGCALREWSGRRLATQGGVVLRDVLVGVLMFALGAILFAIRGYLNTGDKAVAGALIFVALVAIGIEAIVHFLGP